jgi:hypothetical protein
VRARYITGEYREGQTLPSFVQVMLDVSKNSVQPLRLHRKDAILATMFLAQLSFTLKSSIAF